MSPSYTERFARILQHIDEHLDEPLSVESLCQLANFSRFHFQRQFTAYVGLPVVRYMQLMRLRRASYQLLFDEQRQVIDVALEAGFENPESFSRAFKKQTGQTPTQFRTQPDLPHWKKHFQPPNLPRNSSMIIEIIDFEDTLIAVLEHQGSPDLILDSVRIFIDWRKESGLSPVSRYRTFGIPYSDPDTTSPEDFRFDIGGEVDSPAPENPQGVINKQIPGGRCARLRHIGSADTIKEPVLALYQEWLPESEEELRDFPVFFHYIKRVPEVPEHEQVTDIYLPLQ
ncbi:MAG TPA: helix-turn-helix domain-containing protein [Gammaproteobacteria bacterium]|nr:helix-turn-helix domain-containing protein [Gammaproteobacteria bacterium]